MIKKTPDRCSACQTTLDKYAKCRVSKKSPAQLKPLVFSGLNHQRKPIAKAHLEKKDVFATKKA